MRWKFSHLKKTSAPTRAFTVREVSTGVRWASPASRAAAASTLAYRTGSELREAFIVRWIDESGGSYAAPGALTVPRGVGDRPRPKHRLSSGCHRCARDSHPRSPH